MNAMKNLSQHVFKWAILVMLIFLFINSIKQPVAIAGYPHFVFMVDVSGSMRDILPNLDSAIIEFIDELPDSTYIHVATFHEKAKVVFAQELHDSSRIQLSTLLICFRINTENHSGFINTIQGIDLY
jgi:hypothetical protein